jgi:hypothetical protein
VALLGRPFIDVETTIVETVESLIAKGHAHKRASERVNPCSLAAAE